MLKKQCNRIKIFNMVTGAGAVNHEFQLIMGAPEPEKQEGSRCSRSGISDDKGRCIV
jgi:hypothetical protein